MGFSGMADGQADRQKHGGWTITVSISLFTGWSIARQREWSMHRYNEITSSLLFLCHKNPEHCSECIYPFGPGTGYL